MREKLCHITREMHISMLMLFKLSITSMLNYITTTSLGSLTKQLYANEMLLGSIDCLTSRATSSKTFFSVMYALLRINRNLRYSSLDSTISKIVYCIRLFL